MDAPPGSLNSRQYAIGVTPDYLITVELAIWGLPGELKRTPLEKIAVARFSQATLVDHVELHIAGREMPMSFFFYPICRPLVSQIVEALRSGADAHGLGGSAVP
jgi:hypothetical protein